jgi:hypothetical protein
MEENKEKSLEDILSDAQVYIDTRVEHTKLSILEKASKMIADLITNAAVIVCFVLAFLFASITLALYLSAVLGSYAAGFGCVASIYLLLSIIVFLTKDKYIEQFLINIFIRKYFDKVADKDEDDEEKL